MKPSSGLSIGVLPFLLAFANLVQKQFKALSPLLGFTERGLDCGLLFYLPALSCLRCGGLIASRSRHIGFSCIWRR